MKRTYALLVLAILPGILRAEDPVPEFTELLKKAAAYRPGADGFVWRQIPWYADPAAAVKQARDENRPLFVWLAGGRDRDGTPLERC